MRAEASSAGSHEDPTVIGLLSADPAEQADGLARMGLERASILIFENACENRCFFCANPGTLHVPPDRMTKWEKIERFLVRRPADVDTLLVGGNDPVLHPEFDRAIEHADRCGYRSIHVMTSGLSLEPARLAAWRDHGVVSLSVPVYAAEAALHDAVCGTRCFDRMVVGLAAAKTAGLRIHVHTIAMRRTLHGIPALARWVASEFGGPLAVAPLREKSDVFRYDDEAVSLERLAAFLAALDADVTVSLLGMPSCVAPQVRRGGSAVMEVYFRTQRRNYAEVCSGCGTRQECPGVVVAELERRGAAGLDPHYSRS